MKKLLASILLCASALTYAGDASKLTHIGFSADGKYYAFMQSGVHDGSGGSYAEISFLEVATNRFAAQSIKLQETEEELNANTSSSVKVFEARALKLADASLKKLGINQKAQALVSRKIEDLDTRKLKEANFSLNAIIPGLWSPQFKISLEVTKGAFQTTCLSEPSEARKMKLKLTNTQTKVVTVLQEDKVIPKSRGCALNYEIEDVVSIPGLYSETTGAPVVTLLRVFTDGFEGNNVRYIAVSGILK